MTKMTPGVRSALRAAVLLGLALSGVVMAFATIAPAPDTAKPLPVKALVVDSLKVQQHATVLPSPSSYVREATLQRGDTLTDLLGQLGIADGEMRQLLRVRALRWIRPGVTADADVDASGRLIRLSFLAGRDALVTVTPDGEGFNSERAAAALATRVVMKSGVIRSTLFAATDAAGIPDRVARQLTNIFGSDIDFSHDLRRGDRFTVVYKMRYWTGRPVHSGRVLAAQFVNRGKMYRALYYEGADGKGGYYSPDGKSLQKAFLRAPLNYTRVSSGFGMRLDPYLHKWCMHEGVDLAAPAGTHVFAAADGVVKFAGRERGYGNVIILRHWGPYSTLYAHLRHFAHGIHRGVRVKEGELIGYVGETGWATGPHLHYEFRIAGRPRNPLTVALPSARPVPARDLASFQRSVRPLLARLDLLNDTRHLASAGVERATSG